MFCRYCGRDIPNDSVFCAYCGKRQGDDLNGIDDIFNHALANKREAEEKHRKALAQARANIIMGQYQPAFDFYTKLIEEDPSDPTGYIGYIRIASGNYAAYTGSRGFRRTDNGQYVCIELRSYYVKLTQLLGGSASGDSEYDEYVKRLCAYDREQKRLQEEADARRKRELAEAQRLREEEERKRREAEEAERRKKPIEYAEALKQGNELLLLGNYGGAYGRYERALELAAEIDARLPDGFEDDLFKACANSGYINHALTNKNIVQYFIDLANGGNVDAQYYLGYIYFMYNESSGGYDNDGYYSIQKRYPYRGGTATSWLKKAADANHPEAMVCIGDEYRDKAISERNENSKRDIFLQAYYWYKKAADIGCAEADRRIAHAHLYGQGVAIDVERALMLYKKTDSYVDVARIYQYNKLDRIEAIRWYNRAGDIFAVARLYEELGRKSDAINCYRQCVEKKIRAEEAQKQIAKLLYG